MSELAELIEATLAIDPAAPAVEFEGAWRSWAELAATMTGIDKCLVEAGLGSDARIGLVLRNRPAVMAAIAGLLKSGRCLVALNATFPDARLAEDICATGVPALVIDALDWRRDALREAAARADCLVVGIGGPGGAQLLRTPAAPLDARPGLRAAGIALEMLTSGTTGKPKRVPIARPGFEKSLLDAALFESGRAGEPEAKLRSGIQILSAPLAHTSGLQAAMNALLAGRKSCLLEKFTVDAFCGAIARHRPKVASATPTGLQMILDAGVPRETLASLVALRTGAAALPPEVADLFMERYGIPVLQNYGATEFGGVAGWTPADFKTLYAAKRGAVGRMNPGVDARIVSETTGDELPLGAAGLLELRGRQIGDGRTWLRTSDLAVLDEDRFLWIKGRADGAILRGGFKIHPEDVAAAMQAHPSIAEAAVVGLPDARLGEVPAAAYTLRPGCAPVAAGELSQFLRDRLAPYQVPARFLQLAEMPRTESLKLSLAGVRDLFRDA